MTRSPSSPENKQAYETARHIIGYLERNCGLSFLDVKQDDWDAITRLCATQPAAPAGGETITKQAAMEAIQTLRHAAAANFADDNCKGQRGQDRCDALYDAYHAVRKLTPSPIAQSSEGEKPSHRSAATEQPIMWVCLVPGPAPADAEIRIRAWTADRKRMESLRSDGLDMQPLYTRTRDVAPSSEGESDGGAAVEKILHDHFYTGEPGEHDAIKSAAKLLCVRGGAAGTRKRSYGAMHPPGAHHPVGEIVDLAQAAPEAYRETVRKVAAVRERRLADAYAALRSIAEGNLGDASWQANYETIKQVARNALAMSSTHYQPEEITKAEMDAIEEAAIAGKPLTIPRPLREAP